MDLWERFRNLGLTWAGIVATIAALVLALFLRRLLPADRRHRGRATVIVLCIAPLLHFVATGVGALGAPALSAALYALNVIFLGAGVTGVVGLLVFDIALGRTRVPTIVRDISLFLAFAAVVAGVLSSSGLNPVSLITTSAVLTAIIGLAFQNIMANLLAGIALQIDRTVTIGDWIQIGARRGKISQIRWRSTSVVTKDGFTVIVPNAELLSKEVLNYSKPKAAHRVSLTVPFHHGHAPADIQRVLLAALRDVPGILAEPAPSCSLDAFQDKHNQYSASFWIGDVSSEGRLMGEARSRIWYAAERAELEGPCPGPDRSSGARLGNEDLAARLDALAAVDVLAPLGASLRAELAPHLKRQRFVKGETILRQGDPGDSLYFIESGSVRVELTQGGATREIATVGAGEFFGEMSLLTGEPRQASCVAVSDVTSYVLGYRGCREVLGSKPELVEEISVILERRQAQLEGGRADLTARSGEAAGKGPDSLLQRMRTYFHWDRGARDPVE